MKHDNPYPMSPQDYAAAQATGLDPLTMFGLTLYADCEKGQTAAKTGCTPKSGGGGGGRIRLARGRG